MKGVNMNSKTKVLRLAIAGLLCAVGIVIPMFSPIKILLEPASFTLASHVAIFIAMFISPSIAAIVAIGTTVGFFLGGFPIVIVARAATHVVFAVVGAFILKKRPGILDSLKSSQLFSFGIGVLHGLCEVIAVTPFYLNNLMAPGFYSKGYLLSVVLLVGVGSLVHSMVDFAIAQIIWRPLKKTIKPL
ncbi:MAG: hypothetical protein AAGU74_07685 [Bacillota bacterium]